MNIPLGLWIFCLGKHFQGGTVFDILEKSLGRFVCIIISIAYIILNITIGVCMLNLFTGTVRVYFLERTPSWVIMLILILMSTLFINSGIQNFSRLIELLIVLCVINFFVGISLSFTREFKIEHITPIFDTSLPKFAEGMVFIIGSVAESLFFLMVMVGSVPDPHRHYRWVIKGFTYWAFILTLSTFIVAGDVGTEVLSRIGQGGITVARIIYLGGYIRGLEVLILMTYQYIAIVKIIMVLYSCWIASKKLISIKKPWILLIVLSLITFAASVWVNSYNTGYFLAVFLGYYFVLPSVVFVLLLASLSVVIKKRKKGYILKNG
jgi:hypothetical protein